MIGLNYRIRPQLVMGTVQIGIPYGRKAHLGLCSLQEAEQILDAGWSYGIRAFDTAVGYGESVTRLSNWLHSNKHLERSHLITKIPIGDCASVAGIKNAIEPFEGALSITVLTHGFITEEYWNNFSDICISLRITPGQSVYSAEEIRHCRKIGVTKVQAPGNVLDFAQIQAATDGGIEMDIRSVFLQGSLLAPPLEAEMRVPGLGGICELIGQMADSFGVSKVSLLINAVLANVSPAMRLVIGADNASEIADWVSALDEDKSHGQNLTQRIREKFGSCISQSMIDPRLWK